jgi:hypothetical protein
MGLSREDQAVLDAYLEEKKRTLHRENYPSDQAYSMALEAHVMTLRKLDARLGLTRALFREGHNFKLVVED